MRMLLARLADDRRGAGVIEYGLVAAFIAVALVAALPSLQHEAAAAKAMGVAISG